jgi:O-antigen/teichoic acid export membrane protein
VKLILKKVADKSGIDGAIAYTILNRLIQALGGIGSIIFITKFLSADEQGYYYTFASIIAIQIFFELGLSGIITQYAAYEFAHLKWTKNFELEGDEMYKSRLSSLLRFCVKWFGLIAFVFFFVLIIAGFFFFLSYNKGVNINWKNPWLILCVGSSLNLFIDPILAFFDGLGEIKDMAKIRLIQRVVNILLLYGLFILGYKLYSSAIASLVAISINFLQIIFSNRLRLLKVIWKAKDKWTINYLEEIFPFQWKIALSWISGYLIFQLFVPVIFATSGSVTAGRMGMTLAALSGVLSISLSWINTKVPLFSELISRQQFKDLDNIFFKTVKQASAICILCLIILITIVTIFQHMNIAVGFRFLLPYQLILLSIASFVNQFVSALATYLRCHKKEPFLIQSIVLAILTSLSTLLLGRFFGVNGIIIGYTAIILFISLSWSILIFIKKRVEWHQVN